MPEKIRREYIIGGALMVGTLAMLILTSKKAGAISPEDIILSNLVIEPTAVPVHGLVVIWVTATNTGRTKGPFDVICMVNERELRFTVAPDPGESAVASFTVSPDVAGIYSVRADGLVGAFTAYGA